MDIVRDVTSESDIFYPQQLEAYNRVIAEDGGVVWMGIGAGKTRVGLMAAHKLAGSSKCIVVFARREAFYDWVCEIATLQLPYKTYEVEQLSAIHNFTIERSIILVSNGMILNESVQWQLNKIKDQAELGAIIIDEGYLYKNPNAKSHKVLREFVSDDVSTIVLSGSIMTANDLVDIFGQVAVSGKMKRLSKNLTSFREEFQRGINDRGFMSWYPKAGSYKTIMDRVEPFSYIYIPRKSQRVLQESILKVPATDAQLTYFQEIKKTAALEGKFELTNMANIVTKVQQISNGWIKDSDGLIDYIDSPKVDRCIALVREIVETGKKVVVWCAFREDISRLEVNMPCNVAIFQGGQKFNIEKWNKPDTMVCLATEASGSSVNHFAQVPYGIYFSQDYKWLSLQQSQGRHMRVNSQHPTTFFTFLHTEKSLDANVYYTVRVAASQERGFINEAEVRQWLSK